MKGWLQRREGPFFALRNRRFYYRLQWGFLSQHLTDCSAAMVRYFLHDATISVHRAQLRLTITLGPLGTDFDAHTSGESKTSRLVLHTNNLQALQTWHMKLQKSIHRDVYASYELDAIIGAGSEAVVHMARLIRHRGTTVAVKCIPLRPSNSRTDETFPARLKRTLTEVQLQHRASIRGAQVAAVRDVFYNTRHAFIVLERATGGSLTRLLQRTNGRLREAFVRNIISQLALSMFHLHAARIIHRDIKCDNVLMTDVRAGFPLRVILSDFGFAVAWREECGRPIDGFCETVRGTASYLAPEVVLERAYGAPADVFALGVVAHVCLTGSFPFDAQDARAWSDGKEVLENGVRFPHLRHADLSQDAKGFCMALLQFHCRKRFTAAAVLQHRWLRDGRDVAVVRRRRLGVDDIRASSVFRRDYYAVLAILLLRTFTSGRSHSTTKEHVQSSGCFSRHT